MFHQPRWLQFWLFGLGLACDAFLICYTKQLVMQRCSQRLSSRKILAHIHHRQNKSICSTKTALLNMKSPDTVESDDFWSLTSLRRRFQDHILHNRAPLHRRNHAGLCVAVAGGGSTFISTLAATPGASSILMDATLLYGRESHRDYLEIPPTNSPSESLVSAPAAEQLADAACGRALNLIATHDTRDKDLRHYRSAQGLSCTSKLQSTNSTYNSEAYIACRGSLFEDAFVTMHVKLQRSRDRFEEDVFLAHCMLSTLQLFEASMTIENVTEVLPDQLKVSKIDNYELEATSNFGDTLQIKLQRNHRKSTIDRIEEAAERVLTSKTNAVMIRPNDDNSDFEVLRTLCMMKHALVFPGSFNPPHRGHAALAQASIHAMKQCDIVFFEISITNPDKPPIPANEVAMRVLKFLELAKKEFEDIKAWGILLTNAPLFTQKARLLSPDHGELTFAVGSDTMVRIIDPKYYNHSTAEMLSVLTQMNSNFVVGGRLEQKGSAGEFVTGSEHLEQLPKDLATRFTVIPDFRVDISSTEIRRQQQH